MVLSLPNVRSATGLATKFSPHWFHVWWYRHICRVESAGEEGRGPFRTFLRESLAMPRLKRFAAERGLKVRFAKEYGDRRPRGKGGRLRFCFRLTSIPIEVLTLRRISALNEAIMLVLQKGHSE